MLTLTKMLIYNGFKTDVISVVNYFSQLAYIYDAYSKDNVNLFPTFKVLKNLHLSVHNWNENKRKPLFIYL